MNTAQLALLVVLMGSCMTPKDPASSAAVGPRSAHVAATVLQCAEGETRFDCAIRVEQVHSYGASTRPLPQGTRLDVRVQKTLLADVEAAESAETLLVEGRVLDLTLRHQSSLATEDEEGTIWHVVQIH